MFAASLSFVCGLVRLADLYLQFADRFLHLCDLGVALLGADAVLVDDGAGADVFGLVGVAEGGQGFVVVGGGDAGDHGGFAVPA